MISSEKGIILTEYRARKKDYEYLCKTVERIIKELIDDEKIEYSTITSRTKELSSMSKKLDGKPEKYNSLNDITDIAGIRIITYYSEDVDKIADIIKKEFNIDWENSIDKRELLDPDRFGYLSLHYVAGLSQERLALREYSHFQEMKFEIQIRSILQHTWAEIEHDLGYKSDIEIPRQIRRNFSRLAGLLEIADEEFMNIKHQLLNYKEEVEKKLQKDNIESQSIMLDAISLNAYITSNEEIAKINFDIANLAKTVISPKLNNQTLLSTLNELTWLNILNINDLKAMTINNKELAYRIAQKYLRDKEYKPLSKTIGIFYLCYAQLAKNYNATDIAKYFQDNSIGTYDTKPELLAELLLSSV